MKTLTLPLLLVAFASLAGSARAAVSSCTGMPDGTPCADGDACTTDDRCRNETCYAGTNICTDGGAPMPLAAAQPSDTAPTIPAWCLPVADDGGVNPKSRVGGGGGCSMAGHGEASSLGMLLMVALALGLMRRRKLLALAFTLAASGCATTARTEKPRDARLAVCERACDRVLDSMATSVFDGGDTCYCFAPNTRWERRHPVRAELTLVSRPDGTVHASR